jgi:uncharacterized membrane protein YqgA involved in biofilm formation
MFGKLKNILFYGVGGMIAAIPFMAFFGSIYHFTNFFTSMHLDWSMIVLYCGACGGVMFGMWMTEILKDKNIK